ncbi:hypothetical protein EAI_02557 [Harpegnathos saltator]|uniref:Uncharacterized protein n=1 Tax=Harpegnathos saltator TaxID=610380 RepID=E2B754_HARSA|nr:hypothetical protein EAI_02557 [Harpegnathos saltator]
MGLQQQAASQDTVDFAGYLQSTQCHHGNQAEGQVQSCQKSTHREHNSSFTSTKGLLNGPGQNNCFLNSAVQEIQEEWNFPREDLDAIFDEIFHGGFELSESIRIPRLDSIPPISPGELDSQLGRSIIVLGGNLTA